MLWLVAAAAVSAAVQDAPRVFSTKVELVAVDLLVVDADGRPVRDLGPSEFRLQVEGRPRRVMTAEFVPLAQESDEPPPTPVDSGFTTNEAARPGRLVLLMVDTTSIEKGTGRDEMAGAIRMLDHLGPTDRVGLLTIPSSGQREEFTTDHERVRKALSRVVGRGVLPSLSEALASHEVPTPNGDVPNLGDVDPTWMMRMQYEATSSGARDMIKAAFETLRPLPGQKVVILVSQGLGFPDMLQSGTGGPELRQLVAAALAARVSFYVVPVIPRFALPDISADIDPDFDSGRGAAIEMDRQIHFSGLEALAVDAGGAVLRGEPARSFERVLSETSGYYRLGFAPEGNDRDGTPRKLSVSVTRPGLVVRGRPVEVFQAAASPQEAKDDLVAALSAPTLATSLPVRVATWSLAAAESGKVKLLIGAEIGREAEPRGLAVGYVLLDAKGKVAASASQPLRGDARPATGPLAYSASATIAPGAYTLRLAVRDGRGRLGSVDHPVEAGLVPAGTLAVSDLLLGRVPGPGGTFHPAVVAETQEALLVRGEIYDEEGPALESATATLEVVSSETGASLRTSAGRLVAGKAPGSRVVQMLLPVAGLEPGHYLARLVVASGGIPRGAVVRPFRLLPR